MGNPGKVYSKKKLAAMVEHYGTHTAMAKAVGCSSSSITRAMQGSTIWTPLREKLDAVYYTMKKEKEAPPTLAELLREAASRAAETDKKGGDLTQVLDNLNRIEMKLDRVTETMGKLAREWGIS